MTHVPRLSPRWTRPVGALLIVCAVLLGFGGGREYSSRVTDRKVQDALIHQSEQFTRSTQANNDLLARLDGVLRRYEQQTRTNMTGSAALRRAYLEVHALYCQIVPAPRDCASPPPSTP